MRNPIRLGLILIFCLAFIAGSWPASAHNLALDAQSAPARLKLAPQLQAELSILPDDQQTTVIVTLADQDQPNRVPGEVRAVRQRRVIEALQAKANVSQRRIKALLSIRRYQGKVSQVTPLWINNALSVTATADVIVELGAYNEVQSITPDEIQIVPLAPLAYTQPRGNLVVVKAPALWDLGFFGQGVVVANMDSGVDVTHPDLAGSWRGGNNSWYDPYNQHPTTPTDLSGHGTWTMGVMVGGDNSGNSLGVAPQAKWIAVKIFDDAGGATATAIHLGYQWLLDPDGDPNTPDAPQVVNNSWAYGIPGCNLEFQPDLQALLSAGILPVFAAGNYGPGGSTSVSPANYPEAFAVGTTNNGDRLYAYSSRGPSACGEAQSIFPELVAPGVNIYTPDLYGQYAQNSGTSLSAPHVAGGVALLLSAYPNLDAAQLSAALENSAVDLGVAGPDNLYGYGRLDLLAAYQTLANGGGSPTATPVVSTATATTTLLPTATNTPLPTATPTNSPSPIATSTSTPLPTATNTPLPSPTPTNTPLPTATPTDIPSPTATATIPAAPTATATGIPGTNSIHTSDLDGQTIPSSRSRWHAAVIVEIHDGNHLPMAGITVTGEWSNGASGSRSCTTDASGTCSLIKTNIASGSNSVLLTITSATGSGWSYQPSANHDPDGDSDGTSITVFAP